LSEKWNVLKFVLLAIFTLPLAAQQSAPAAGKPLPVNLSTGSSVPDTILYRALFRHIAHLEEVAANPTTAPAASTDLRAYYQNAAKLTAQEDRDLKRIAQKCDADVKQKDAAAKAIIDSVRARYPGGRLPDRASLPSIPSDLDALKKDRDVALTNCIGDLSQSFGQNEFQRFHQFVKTQFAPQVNWIPLLPPNPSGMNPAQNPAKQVTQ
jgi:hypothetical protein